MKKAFQIYLNSRKIKLFLGWWIVGAHSAAMAHHKSSKHKHHKRKHKSKQKGSSPADRFVGEVTPVLSQWQVSVTILILDNPYQYVRKYKVHLVINTYK